MSGCRLAVVAPATANDVPFLWELLSAAARDAGLAPLTPSIAEDSPFGKYLTGWGRPGDAGVVAFDQTGWRLGAAWYRLFSQERPGYGFTGTDVPELSIRVLEAARGEGVGSALLAALERLAQQQGYRALSLSVKRTNPARHLYARHGFQDAQRSARTDASLTLLKSLQAPL